jgi:hypothetical protein
MVLCASVVEAAPAVVSIKCPKSEQYPIQNSFEPDGVSEFSKPLTAVGTFARLHEAQLMSCLAHGKELAGRFIGCVLHDDVRGVRIALVRDDMKVFTYMSTPEVYRQGAHFFASPTSTLIKLEYGGEKTFYNLDSEGIFTPLATQVHESCTTPANTSSLEPDRGEALTN